MGWIGCPILQVAHKAIVRFQFLSYFAVHSSSRHEKRYHILGKLFIVLEHSRNTPWHGILLSGALLITKASLGLLAERTSDAQRILP